MAKKKEKWTQIGNFLLGIENAASGNRFVARSVSGDWRIMWEEGTMMYVLMLSYVNDANTHEYIQALLTLYYAATNYPHDMVSIIERQQTPVMDGFAKLIDEQTAFEVSVKGEATAEEDEKALKEVAEMEEVREELEKLDAENGQE